MRSLSKCIRMRLFLCSVLIMPLFALPAFSQVKETVRDNDWGYYRESVEKVSRFISFSEICRGESAGKILQMLTSSLSNSNLTPNQTNVLFRIVEESAIRRRQCESITPQEEFEIIVSGAAHITRLVHFAEHGSFPPPDRPAASQ